MRTKSSRRNKTARHENVRKKLNVKKHSHWKLYNGKLKRVEDKTIIDLTDNEHKALTSVTTTSLLELFDGVAKRQVLCRYNNIL